MKKKKIKAFVTSNCMHLSKHFTFSGLTVLLLSVSSIGFITRNTYVFTGFF